MPEVEKKKSLVSMLLKISGNTVEVPENVSDDILKFGHLIEHDVIIAPGGTSRLYMSQQEQGNMRVASGFVLTGDGTWRSHAWLVLKNNGYKIIDNIRAEKYFGIVMPY